MRNYCIYDLETFKNERLEEFLETKEFKPDARLKDPEKIKKSIEDKKESVRKNAALDWITGRVIACGISYKGDFQFFTADNERDLLRDINVFIAGKDVDDFVGKNNHDFDQPFLIGRHLANGIPVPHWLRRKHIDVQQYFGSPSRGQRRSMADIEWAMNIQRDGEKDATQCFEWWENGDLESIERYNRQDVETTERIYLEITNPMQESSYE